MKKPVALKPPPRPTQPSAEQGGHRWVPGKGMAVCAFGCGAFEEEHSSDEPRTDPMHMCPRNPRAHGKFKIAY